MADVIAAGIVGSLAIIGAAGFYSVRLWLRIRAADREAAEAVRIVRDGRAAELTASQRESARGYYMSRWVANGRLADKQRLEELETLEGE